MKAMMGAAADLQTLRLLDEIRALRSRVEELETALAEAEAESEKPEPKVAMDLVQVVGATA